MANYNLLTRFLFKATVYHIKNQIVINRLKLNKLMLHRHPKEIVCTPKKEKNIVHYICFCQLGSTCCWITP